MGSLLFRVRPQGSPEGVGGLSVEKKGQTHRNGCPSRSCGACFEVCSLPLSLLRYIPRYDVGLQVAERGGKLDEDLGKQ